MVEVVSPNDSASSVQRKAMEYLQSGVRMVWLVDPEVRSIAVYETGEVVRFFGIDDKLDGGDVLPGFSVPVADVFA